MPKMLTAALLKKHTEFTYTFRRVSELEGEPVEGRFRWVGREEYVSMAPANPPGAASWPREEFGQRFAEWFEALPANVQEARTQQARDLLYRIVAATALDPKLTIEQARALGSDAEEAGVEVLFASGILKRPEAPAAAHESPEETSEEPAELRDAA